MNVNEVKAIIESGTIEIYEQMVDRKNMIYGYYLKIDKDTSMGRVLNKCFTTGYNRCIGLRIDSESIMGFIFEFVTEKLLETDYEEWSNMTWKKREEVLVLYCNNKFRELSKQEGTNFGVSYGWNSEDKKMDYEVHNNTSYEIMMEQGLESEIDEQMREKRSGDFTSYIFETYINEDYLTSRQLQFINNCLNNYIDIHGNVRDIVTDEILHTSTNACKLRQHIKKRLMSLLEKDIHLDDTRGRFNYKK